MKYCIGVDIGGTTVKMGIFDMTGIVLDKWEIPTKTENMGSAILPDIAVSIENKRVERRIPREEVCGIGVGVPAPVDSNGVVKNTVNLGWGYKEVRKELEELTGYSVQVDNDANIAALGEMWKGGGEGYQNMVMVTLGTGVGGGIITNGHIVSSATGASGEIGHMCMNLWETEKCNCGKRGCLEQYASATGLVRMAKKKLADFEGETVLDMRTVTAKDIFDAVKAGDEPAKEIAKEFGRYLGTALANIAAVVDPSVFVIGGGVSKAGQISIDYVKDVYDEMAFFAHKDMKFALAKLGNDAGIYGAAKLIQDKGRDEKASV